VLNQQNYYFCN